MSQLDATTLWAKVKQEVIDKAPGFNLVLADALNAVRPVTIDGDLLVLGFDQGGTHHGGVLLVPDKKNLIEVAMRNAMGRAMTYQFIEGTEMKDWEFVKQRQQRATTHTETAYAQKKTTAGVTASVDELIQELHRRYQALEGRGFPQVKVKWMLDMIPGLVNLEQKLAATGDEQFFRQWARVIDKASSLTDIPAVVIALELERVKRSATP